jgi:tetratricopeptide (TPR) repeat protein
MSIAKNSFSSTLKEIFTFGGIGLLIGLLVIAIAEAKLSFETASTIRQGIVQHFDAGTETQYLLGQASYAWFKGEYQNVVTILSPNIGKFKERSEAAEAYYYLAASQFNLGQHLLAAGYFELMYANKPTSQALYLTAVAYDRGGNLDNALEKYSLVLAINDGTVNSGDLAQARQRIQEIMTIKGISNPAP